MREILFRGKRKDNGEWEYGNLIISPMYKNCIMIERRPEYMNTRDYSTPLVDPETVGQYTGLKDRNGQKIFEGDIVKAIIVRDYGEHDRKREETGVIAYDCIGIMGLVIEYYEDKPVFTDFFHELSLSGCIRDHSFEVIGNIHDNPELIKK